MKIINKQEFLRRPRGTIYREYRPCVFGPLCIKWDTVGNDFYYIEIGQPGAPDSTDIMDVCKKMENGENVGIDLEVATRDSMFDDNQLYAVFSVADMIILHRMLNIVINEQFRTH